MKSSRVPEMRQLDRKAIQEFGIAAELLMENAGQAVHFALLNDLGIAGKRLVVFCGLGNNGGDGLAVARKIHSSGGAVKVFCLGDPGRFKGAAKTNLEIVSQLPPEIGTSLFPLEELPQAPIRARQGRLEQLNAVIKGSDW